MNNDKDKYDELINQIKVFQPQMPDSQRLISKTMDSIERLSKKRKHNKILIFVSWSSSIAASFLIGMFLFEIFSPPKNKEFASTKITPVNITPALDENAIIKNPMTLRDFKKIVSMKQEQRAFYSSLVNKNKLLYK